MTPLDAAHAEIGTADAEAGRRTFWSVVAASELHLWLAAEAEGATVTPELFEIEGVRYALAFDGEDRLAAFAGRPVAHATLPGRRLANMLSASGLGLGLNFGAPSQTLMPPDLVAWLAATADVLPETALGRVARLSPPTLAREVVRAIDRRLASAEGLARHAWLAAAEWEDGRQGHLLAVEEAMPGAGEALARSVAEALAFAGAEAAVDVAAVAPGSPLAERLARVALRFDLPEAPAPAAPDPSRPPRLR